MEGWSLVEDIIRDSRSFILRELGDSAKGLMAALTRPAPEQEDRFIIGHFPVGDEKAAESICDELTQLEYDNLATAEPAYVNDEFWDLTRFAAETYELRPFRREDFWAHNVFIKFPHPLPLEGVPDNLWAMHWWPVPGHLQGIEGPYNKTRVDTMWITLYGNLDQAAAEEDGLGELASRAPQHVLFPFGAIPVPLDTDWLPKINGPDGEFDDARWVFLQTLLTLASQRVGTRTVMDLPRAARRRAERYGHVPRVSVLTLRRRRTKHSQETGDEEANYSHRFLVRGHWRNQWYPSRKGNEQIWISSYVKGPEDKPFVAKKRAFNVVR